MQCHTHIHWFWDKTKRKLTRKYTNFPRKFRRVRARLIAAGTGSHFRSLAQYSAHIRRANVLIITVRLFRVEKYMQERERESQAGRDGGQSEACVFTRATSVGTYKQFTYCMLLLLLLLGDGFTEGQRQRLRAPVRHHSYWHLHIYTFGSGANDSVWVMADWCPEVLPPARDKPLSKTIPLVTVTVHSLNLW
jgi:hypothetical protein